jgi:hypothetical protein
MSGQAWIQIEALPAFSGRLRGRKINKKANAGGTSPETA